MCGRRAGRPASGGFSHGAPISAVMYERWSTRRGHRAHHDPYMTAEMVAVIAVDGAVAERRQSVVDAVAVAVVVAVVVAGANLVGAWLGWGFA